jgi:RimJ/RimL family protein N-acetyltransferase
MIRVSTSRLDLIAADLDLAEADAGDRGRFAVLLGAGIPDGWPPGELADARDFFREALRDRPQLHGWLTWYAVLRDPVRPVLVGSVGFKGRPDAAGMVEIGYSVVPEFERRGVATEMVRGLIDWAFGFPEVACIEAETDLANLGSRRVLDKCGFARCGPGLEPSGLRYRLPRQPDQAGEA